MVPAQPTQVTIQETADRLRPSRAGETVAMKAEAGSSYTASSAGLSSPRRLGGRRRRGGKEGGKGLSLSSPTPGKAERVRE